MRDFIALNTHHDIGVLGLKEVAVGVVAAARRIATLGVADLEATKSAVAAQGNAASGAWRAAAERLSVPYLVRMLAVCREAVASPRPDAALDDPAHNPFESKIGKI